MDLIYHTTKPVCQFGGVLLNPKVEALQLLVGGDEAFAAAGRVKDSVTRHSRNSGCV